VAELLPDTESEAIVKDLFRYRDLLIGLRESPLLPPEKLEWIKKELELVERRLKYEVENE